MNRKTVTLLSLLLLTFLLVSCGTSTEEAVEPAPVEVVEEEAVPTPEPEPIEVVESNVEDYLTLSQLSAGIRDGSIDVGEEFGMGTDARFHTIHAQTVGLSCVQCHVQEAPEEVAGVFEGSPGVVDRRVCLGCHLTGPATLLYEPKE
jgi:hypothetical protein